MTTNTGKQGRRCGRWQQVVVGALAGLLAVQGISRGQVGSQVGSQGGSVPGPGPGGGRVLSPGPAANQEAPLSLTGSDGTGLQLTSLSAQVVLEDPLAFTELHLVFHNPEDRVREGRFRITLPSGAVISRFAMKIDGRFQEGEVVELQAARQAYEDFLHRRQDPALLETEAGNEFSARVFPIPPRASKELIVSYSQERVRASQPYRLPLRGLPRLGSLHIRAVSGAGRPLVELARQDHLPDRRFRGRGPRRAGTDGPAPRQPGGRPRAPAAGVAARRSGGQPDGAAGHQRLARAGLQ